MDLLAAVNRGAPPIGLGMFLRDRFLDGPWSWVAVNGGRADYAHESGLAKGAGKQLWLYAMPGSFTPTGWRDGLALLLVRCAEVGATGIIVDPETEWGNGADQIAAFGAALRDAATRTRVGITSYPSWGPMPALATAAGDACFGIPQIYGQPGAFTRAEIESQWSRWRGAFGTRLCVGFSAWVPSSSPTLNDPAEYNAYIDRLPAAGGYIGWISGPIPVHMMQEIQRKWGGAGSMLSMLALGSLAWVGRPAGAVTIGIGIALLVLGILLMREVSRA